LGDRVIIIGGTAAGSKAAATARRRNPDLDIMVLQSGAEVSYSACGMPYYMSDEEHVPRKMLVARTPDQFKRDGIDVRIRHKVEGVDPKKGAVEITNLESGKTWSESFDQLLIATGAEPIEPPIPVAEDAPPVVTLRSFSDMDRIRQMAGKYQRVVIVGGGYIGLEMAETFHALGKQVILAELAPRLLPNFEPSVAETVQAHLEGHGVALHLGTGVAELTSSGVRLDSSEEIQADLVLMAVGLRPNTELAQQAGVNLGATGAITTDAGMHTNVERIFAAGDCTEVRHYVSDKQIWLPLGDVANRQGRVAGENIAGGDAAFSGVLGTAIFKVFDLAVATTGLSEAQAREAGFDPASCQVTALSRARYMPTCRQLDLLLVGDKASGRLLGCQAVGEDGADKAIDTIAAGLWGNLTADDMSEIDLAYAPPFSPVISPVQVAAEVLRKKLKN